MYKSLLETTQNTRDLGGYLKSNGEKIKCCSLIRSDVQKYPSDRDVRFLEEHGITTVIDMREDKAVLKAPSGFANLNGFDYHRCPIEEGSGVPESVEAVPLSYMKIALAENMPKVFSVISHSQNGVMFNCTAGKDRTGVVSAILLLLAGVSDEDIISDYLLTKEYGKERFEAIHTRFPDVDMNVVIPNEANMRSFLRLFKSRFATAEAYLAHLGLTDQDIEKIKQKL